MIDKQKRIIKMLHQVEPIIINDVDSRDTYKKIFYNYRFNGGIRLTKQGKLLIDKNNLLNLVSFSMIDQDVNSSLLSKLDSLLENPYYYDEINNELFVDDDMLISLLLMNQNNLSDSLSGYF